MQKYKIGILQIDSRHAFIVGISMGFLVSYIYYLIFNLELSIYKETFHFEPHSQTSDNNFKLEETKENVTIVTKRTSLEYSTTSQPQLLKISTATSFHFNTLMETVQSERQFTINKACQLAFATSHTKVDPFYIHKKSLYSRNYKVSVCQIQKCGSSSWLRAILVMENYYSVEQYLNEEIVGKKVMDFAEANVSIATFANVDIARKAWKESLKVILVRHPFSRLVSAYYDKMVSGREGLTSYYGPISRKINKTYRQIRYNKTERFIRDNGEATFEDFVNYLIYESRHDEHWRPFDLICFPCQAKYDYIAKFETLEDDLNYLKSKLNLSEYHKKAFFPISVLQTDKNKTQKTFETIAPFLRHKLYTLYQKDFDMFGYERPSWL